MSDEPRGLLMKGCRVVVTGDKTAVPVGSTLVVYEMTLAGCWCLMENELCLASALSSPYRHYFLVTEVAMLSDAPDAELEW